MLPAIKVEQKIEIGGVCCSIGFLDGFFKKEFASIFSDYRRWGFSSEGNPEIGIMVKEGRVEAPRRLKEYVFYHIVDYDSVYATLAFDTRSFEGEIGFSIKRGDRFTPVRIVELTETFIFNAYLFYFHLNDIGTFVHSCGIVDGENGYLFAGPGGEGKSTIASLSLPRTILCDDVILLRKNDKGRRLVFGTPFSGDHGSVNGGAECKGIYFIRKSSINELVATSLIDGTVELMREGVMGGFMSIDGIQRIYPQSRLFDFLLDLLSGVPCFRMKFKKDDSFWKVINEHED